MYWDFRNHSIVNHSSIKLLLVLISPKFIKSLFASRIKLISANSLHFQNNLALLIVLQNGKKFSDTQNKFDSSEYSFYE